MPLRTTDRIAKRVYADADEVADGLVLLAMERAEQLRPTLVQR